MVNIAATTLVIGKKIGGKIGTVGMRYHKDTSVISIPSRFLKGKPIRPGRLEISNNSTVVYSDYTEDGEYGIETQVMEDADGNQQTRFMVNLVKVHEEPVFVLFFKSSPDECFRQVVGEFTFIANLE